MRFLRRILLIYSILLCFSTWLSAQNKAEQDRVSKLQSQLKVLNEAAQVKTLCDIAEIYNASNPDKSLQNIAQAEKILKKIPNDVLSRALVYGGYGSAYYCKKNYKKAAQNFENEAEVAAKSGLPRIQEKALYNAGIAYHASKNYDMAMATFNKSLDLAKKLGDNSFVINNYYALYESASAVRYFKSANEYYIQYINALTGNSSKLRRKLGVLNSSYTGEQRLRVLSYAELQSVDARYVAMDSALSEQQQHYLQLEQESERKIQDLNRKAALQGMELLHHKEENNLNQQLITKQKQAITAFIIICVLVLAGTVLLFFMFSKIKKYNKTLENQKFEIEEQKNLIQIKNDQITDSINYARKIQDSILVPESKIRKYVPDMFIYYKPKDIVSGDFYWFSKYESKYVITAIDCTGHGVPGAFLSMIGNTLLHEIVNIKHVFKPDQILAMLHTGIMLALNQDSEEATSEDGMDMSLCTVDAKLNRFQFAGAKNSLYVVQGDKLKILKANYYSIGGRPLRPDMKVQFTCYDFMYDDSTSIYMFSDGYLDQFGGDTGEKFNTQRFKDMILENREMSMEEQKTLFTSTMDQWKGGRQQIDDFLVMGIKLACINRREEQLQALPE